jgi:hypothetical protein
MVIRKTISLLAAILLFGVAQSVHAYTYTYSNKTDHRIRVSVRLYEEGDRTCDIEAGGSCEVSTKALLKSWGIELFLDDSWRLGQEMTCDMLPGDHPFSIYLKAVRSPGGQAELKWYVEHQ